MRVLRDHCKTKWRLCTTYAYLVYNIGTKCNSLTQQFIDISTTIDTRATCFDSYRDIFRPSKNTDPILQGSQVHCGIPNAYTVVIVTIWNHTSI